MRASAENPPASEAVRSHDQPRRLQNKLSYVLSRYSPVPAMKRGGSHSSDASVGDDTSRSLSRQPSSSDSEHSGKASSLSRQPSAVDP
jgi:hypothetical protein